MALVRKYNSGNLISPNFLEWENVGKYNANQLASVLTLNLDLYIQSQDFNLELNLQFRKLAELGINAIKLGNVKRHTDGGYSGLFDTDSPMSKNFIDYLSNILIISGNANKLEVKDKELKEWNLKETLGNIALGGNWDNNLWNKLSRDSRLNYLSKALQDRQKYISESENSNLSIDKNDWITLNQNLINQLNNKQYTESDLEHSIRLGYGDLNAYILNPELSSEQQNELVSLAEEVLRRIEQRLKERELQETIDKNAWEEYYSQAVENPNGILDQYIVLPLNSNYSNDFNLKIMSGLTDQNGNTFNSTLDIVNVLLKPFNFLNSEQYIPGRKLSFQFGDLTVTSDKYLTMRNALDFLYKTTPSAFKKLSNGFSAIYDTYNPETGTIDLYNPQTGEYKRSYSYNIPELELFLHELFMKTKKVGGILKAQKGIQYPTFLLLNYQKQQLEQNKQIEEKQRLQQKAKEEGKTVEQLERDERVVGIPGISDTEISGEDIARMAAIGLDITSIISSFLPGAGSLVSFGSGVASTLTNLGADIANGMGGWDVTKNALLGLGADVLGIIPGLGIAGKVGKVAKSFKYIAPIALTAWGAMENTQPAYNSAKKLMSNPDNMTVLDWQNIANGLLVLTGISNLGTNAVRNAKLKRKYRIEKKNIVETKKGEVVLSDDALDRIKGKKGLSELNDALHEYYPQEEFLTPFRASYNPKRLIEPLPKVQTQYNVPRYNKFTDPSEPNVTYTAPWYKSEWFWTLKANLGNKSKDKPKVLFKGFKKEILPPEFLPSESLPKTTEVSPSIPQPVIPEVPKKPTTQSNKQTNKKKKKKVSKKYIGGILKGEDGLITGVGLNSGASWYNNNYLKYRDDIANLLQLGIISVDDINGMQALHSKLYKDWKTRGDSYKDDAVISYLKSIIDKYPYVNLKGISSAFNSNLFLTSKNANTGDNPSKGYITDGRYSSITDWRTLLGRPDMLSDELLALNINYWKSKGYDYYLDPDTNYYFLRPLNQEKKDIENPEKFNLWDDLNRLYGNINDGDNSNNRSGFQILPEDVMALGRMVLGYNTNRRAAEKIKEGIRPTLTSTPKYYTPIYGDFLTRNALYNLAAELTNRYKLNYTSDPVANALIDLGYTKYANELRSKGDLAYADRFYKTDLQSFNNEVKQLYEDVENSNSNAGKLNAAVTAKANIDANLLAHLFTNVLNPYLSGLENNWRQNRAIQRNINLERDKHNILNTYGDALLNLYSSYENETNPTLKSLKLNMYRSLSNRMYNDYYDASELWSLTPTLFASYKLYSRPKLPVYNGTVDMIPFSKKGSKVSSKLKLKLLKIKDFNKRLLDDNKLFHKILLETKKEHNKLLRLNSAFVSSLIKDALSWK